MFIVTCAGMSGSKWLASVLNSHPDISCNHSAGCYQIYNRNYTVKELMRILEVERLQFDGTITLESFFDTLRKNKSKEFSGNVHAYRLDRFNEMADKQSFNPNVKVANLVRDPIAVTLSRSAMFKHMCLNDHNVRERMKTSLRKDNEKYEDVLKQFDVDCDDLTNLCFLDSVKGIIRLANEVKNNSHLFHIQLEKLREPDYLIKVIKHLTTENVEISSEIISKLSGHRAINSHVEKKESTFELVNQLNDWQQQILKISVESSNVIPIYESIGYQGISGYI